MHGLRGRRETAGVSARWLAKELRVSHPTVLRWEEAGDAPARRRKEIDQVLAAEATRRSRAATDVVEAEGPIPLNELRRRLGTTGEGAIADALSKGRLLEVEAVSPDAIGRPYMRRVVVSKRRHHRQTLSAGAPIADGAEIRRSRQALGLSSKDFAGRLGVPASLLRLWETGHRAVPRARSRELQEALWPSGAEIRRMRTGAGWTLKYFGSRVGVGVPTVDAWEANRRKVPAARVAAVRAALLECQTAATPEQKLERILDEVLAKIAKTPGLMRSEVLHHRQPRELWQRAINEGLRRGTLVELELPSEVTGRLRTIAALYRPDDAPGVLVEPSLSGADLRRIRTSLGLTQREVGEGLGIPPWTVQGWELRQGRGIPIRHVEPVRRFLEHASPAPVRAREAVQALISARAGIPRSSVPRKHHAALRALLEDGTVREAPAWDAVGRPYRGLYLSSASVVRPPTMDAGELAQLRMNAGVPQRELAGLLGVRSSAVSRWESGARRIPPGQVDRIRAAIEQLRTLHPAATPRLRRPRSAPGPDAPANARMLRRRRLSAGLTQRELGHVLGVTAEAVSHWEHAGIPQSRLPSIDRALASRP